jgi:uncharacterized protein (DUF1015 family)
VVCPPYDVINREQREAYIRNSVNNIVKIVLPERKDGDRDYLKAKKDLYSWIKRGILKKDDTPAIYVYMQEYKIGSGIHSRWGFISALKLEAGNKTNVLPHEKIFSKPFRDRVRLMKETRAHLSPIFMVFRDPKATISHFIQETVRDIRPCADFNFEGVRHKLWVVAKKESIGALAKKIDKTIVFIADGHHRFAASVKAAEYFGSISKKGEEIEGYDKTLVYMVSSGDKGLMILPTHRAVKILPSNFSMEYMVGRLRGYFQLSFISAGRIDHMLYEASKKKLCAFVIYYDNRYLYMALKDRRVIKDIGPKDASASWKNLDVSVLHNLVFAKLLGIKENVLSHRNIYYYKEKQELIKNVRSKAQDLGVFLNPTKMEEVERIAQVGEKMPHKSTYFYPKPLTGLVIHKF